jgi:hypothetical protein
MLHHCARNAVARIFEATLLCNAILIFLAAFVNIRPANGQSAEAAQNVDATMPEVVLGMCQRLHIFNGPIRYAALDAKRDLLLDGSIAKELGVAASFAEWVSGLGTGHAPNYDTALAAFERWSSSPRVDHNVEHSVRILVDYGREERRELCVMRFEDGRFQSELLTETTEFGFQSSVVRLRAAARSENGGSHFVRPSTILYPISLHPNLESWLSTFRWERQVLSDGRECVKAQQPDASDVPITALFDAEYVLPVAFLHAVRIGPNPKDVAHTLTFYRHLPTYHSVRNAFGICEVLQFDTLGVPGVLGMRRIILYNCSIGASDEANPLRLPITFNNPRLVLKDMRDPGGARDYGFDVALWPADILEVLCAFDSGNRR